MSVGGPRYRVVTYYSHDGDLEQQLNANERDGEVVSAWPNHYVDAPDVVVGWTVVWGRKL